MIPAIFVSAACSFLVQLRFRLFAPGLLVCLQLGTRVGRDAMSLVAGFSQCLLIRRDRRIRFVFQAVGLRKITGNTVPYGLPGSPRSAASPRSS